MSAWLAIAAVCTAAMAIAVVILAAMHVPAVTLVAILATRVPTEPPLGHVVVLEL